MIVNKQVCKSQILKCFTFLIFFLENREFCDFLNNYLAILKICRCVTTCPLIPLWKFHTVSITFKIGAWWYIEEPLLTWTCFSIIEASYLNFNYTVFGLRSLMRFKTRNANMVHIVNLINPILKLSSHLRRSLFLHLSVCIQSEYVYTSVSNTNTKIERVNHLQWDIIRLFLNPKAFIP